jgi:hypothetical protein
LQGLSCRTLVFGDIRPESGQGYFLSLPYAFNRIEKNSVINEFVIPSVSHLPCNSFVCFYYRDDWADDH